MDLRRIEEGKTDQVLFFPDLKNALLLLEGARIDLLHHDPELEPVERGIRLGLRRPAWHIRLGNVREDLGERCAAHRRISDEEAHGFVDPQEMAVYVKQRVRQVKVVEDVLLRLFVRRGEADHLIDHAASAEPVQDDRADQIDRKEHDHIDKCPFIPGIQGYAEQHPQGRQIQRPAEENLKSAFEAGVFLHDVLLSGCPASSGAGPFSGYENKTAAASQGYRSGRNVLISPERTEGWQDVLRA